MVTNLFKIILVLSVATSSDIAMAANQIPEFDCVEYSVDRKLYSEISGADADCLLKASFKLLRRGDKKSSLRLLRSAADKGHPRAQTIMGDRLSNGDGFKKDLKKSFEWYSRAAKQNHPYAQSALSDIYYNGNNYVRRDFQKAVSLALESIKNGNDNPILALSYYYSAPGRHKDLIKSYKWSYIVFKKVGIRPPLLNELESKLSAADKKKALLMSEEWLANE